MFLFTKTINFGNYKEKFMRSLTIGVSGEMRFCDRFSKYIEKKTLYSVAF